MVTSPRRHVALVAFVIAIAVTSAESDPTTMVEVPASRIPEKAENVSDSGSLSAIDEERKRMLSLIPEPLQSKLKHLLRDSPQMSADEIGDRIKSMRLDDRRRDAVLRALLGTNKRGAEGEEEEMVEDEGLLGLRSGLMSGVTAVDISERYGVSAALSADVRLMLSAVEAMRPSACRNQSLELVGALMRGETWAHKFYDASAKSAVGLLYGNRFQLGNFDECLSARSYGAGTNVRGQYCLANILYKKKASGLKDIKVRFGSREDIHWAICVPDQCSAGEVQLFISTLLNRSSSIATVAIPDSDCYKEQPMDINNYDIGYLTIIVGFGAIVLASTAYHAFLRIRKQENDDLDGDGKQQKESLATSVALSFSLGRNLAKISCTRGSNELGLDCIAGVRTVSMTLILVGHALLFIVSGPVSNTDFYDEMITRIENSILLSNPLLVDTFLFISAFLFCRLLLSELDKRNGKVNVVPIYIFRYIRVTASYIIVIGFYATWLDKINQGPLWSSRIEAEKQRCQESWWANILYVNNYVNTDNLCMFQSWYLAVDTQLFFLAPLVIYPLWKWRRVGEWILTLTVAATSIVPFVVTYVNRLDPTLMVFSKEVTDVSENYYFKEAYMKTHMRASTYCMGLLFGYVLYRIQTSDCRLPKGLVRFGWITCVVCSTSAIFTVSFFYQRNYVYDSLEAATYNSLHHIAWALANGWFLIACATNNGGFVAKIFSYKLLIPLSRLTYCAYLVNGLVELHSLCTLRTSVHLSIFNLTVLSLSHVCQTFIAALIVCLMFESPIHRIEKILLSTVGKRPDNDKNHNSGSRENKEKYNDSVMK